ncbi:hypothetical protein HRbin39_00941 [bacterium HR39]|nr:hypothetical protein HRbin39_00941 [bacterium HR39]
MSAQPRPFWHPLAAGGLLGVALLLTFLITGHGLGASGFFARMAAWVSAQLAPGWAATNSYFAPFLQAGNPLSNWITWEVIGVVTGGFLGAVAAGRFRLGIERGPNLSTGSRLLFALVGGILVGFGARLAQGCTSGVGLSGAATLAVAGFVFLAGFFLAGFATALFTRRLWQ